MQVEISKNNMVIELTMQLLIILEPVRDIVDEYLSSSSSWSSFYSFPRVELALSECLKELYVEDWLNGNGAGVLSRDLGPGMNCEDLFIEKV